MSLSSTLRRPLFWLIAVPVFVVVAAVGGTFVYVQFIRSDAAPPPDFSALAEGSPSASPAAGSTAPGGSTVVPPGTGGAATGLDGAWTVVKGVAGYRVHEVRLGNSIEAAGQTDKVTGAMTLQGTSVTTAAFTVDLASVKTDESGRDSQFRGRIMNVSKFPTATFKLSKAIDLGSLPPDQTEVTVPATGQFAIHGITREVTFDMTARRNGDRVEVKGSIPVKWGDYGIPDPSFGPNSVDDHGQIEFAIAFAKP
jgi:polyisoprenoid-binding protein YceI